MTLRRRIATALMVVLAVVVLSFALILVRQHAVLTQQLDKQLIPVEENLAETVMLLGNSGLVGSGTGPPTGELFVAIYSEGNEPQQALRPLSDPTFEPVIDTETLASLESVREPFTVDAEGVGGARMVARQLADGSWAVAALPTQSVEAAQRHLLWTALAVLAVLLVLFGFVVFWVDRLGVKPLLEVARTAEKLAGTPGDARVHERSIQTEVGQLAASFNKMLDAQQAAEIRQQRFVADASHELRTPLTTLQGYTALHANGGLSSQSAVDDAMRRIRTEAKRMSNIVERLLTLASLDERRPLSTTTVDLTRLLTDLASDASAIQPQRDVVTAVSPGLKLEADPELLTQALTGNIHNALRHTPVAAGLTIRAAKREDSVRIEIADDGPGIEPQHLDHIFERFYRPEPGRRQGGTGLGLAISKSAIEAHGGNIRVDSSADTGTTVVITLPLRDSQEVSSKP